MTWLINRHDVSDEVNRDAISHKIYRPLVCPSCKVHKYLTQTKNPTSPFQIGDSLIYTYEGHNKMVDMLYLNENDPDIKYYSSKFLHGNKKVATKEFLKSINVPYME